MMDVKVLEEEALNLDVKARAALAERLLESLDALSEKEIERLWADEAQRRLGEFRAGRANSWPAEEVMEDARQRLR